jgi:hypothetical protein
VPECKNVILEGLGSLGVALGARKPRGFRCLRELKKGTGQVPFSEIARCSVELGLRLGGFDVIEGQGEARFVAVAGVFVKDALGDRAVDRRHRGMEKIACGSGVTSGDGGAEAAHHGAYASAIGAVDVGAFEGLLRTLEYRLFPLLDLCCCSLRHLSLLKV